MPQLFHMRGSIKENLNKRKHNNTNVCTDLMYFGSESSLKLFAVLCTFDLNCFTSSSMKQKYGNFRCSKLSTI